MFTYQINVEYLGTNFVGWQFQKNGVSVQEVLEKALSKFLKDKIKVIGSGRTDAGVHAKEQSAHFKTKRKINDRDNFINSMNFFLQKYPVSILNIRKRSKIFHAFDLVGSSQNINSIRDQINKLSVSDSRVFITGPTGSGKEMIARQIHQKSN